MVEKTCWSAANAHEVRREADVAPIDLRSLDDPDAERPGR
jgi:hypothetical protein